ncbi:ATP-binding protein [Pseudonocardia pini]|uniref:ATP-binding protein n=1 Tax=Pseudonocardia pini TaxID=2758030 RepID=UPI0015F0CBBF|nr:ATP-binding protein [Pseudonocardia pini]
MPTSHPARPDDGYLTITTTVAAGTATVRLHGTLSAGNRPGLVDHLSASLPVFDRVVVDLDGLRVERLDLLAAFGEAVDRAGGWPHARLGLVTGDAALTEALRVSGVADQVAVAQAHEPARQGCDRRPGVVHACWTFAHDATSPGAARRVVRAKLVEWQATDQVDADDLALVVGELATNAVDHADSPYTVTARLDHDLLHLVVADQATATPALQPVDPAAARGRGLQMVAAAATDWGWQRTASGKQLWADFRLTGEPG